MTALRAFAVLVFSLSTVGAALASPNAAPARQDQSAAVPPVRQPPACINDPRGSATLQGYLRVNRQSSGAGAIVQLFGASDVADSYLKGIEQQLSGRPPVADRAPDPDAMTNNLTRTQARIALLQSAKFAIVAADGKFDCSGLLPGRYILLGTVVSLQGTTERPSLTQSYFRADVTIPAPNRPRAYLVPTFRLLGVAPL